MYFCLKQMVCIQIVEFCFLLIFKFMFLFCILLTKLIKNVFTGLSKKFLMPWSCTSGGRPPWRWNFWWHPGWFVGLKTRMKVHHYLGFNNRIKYKSLFFINFSYFVQQSCPQDEFVTFEPKGRQGSVLPFRTWRTKWQLFC